MRDSGGAAAAGLTGAAVAVVVAGAGGVGVGFENWARKACCCFILWRVEV